MVLATTGHRHMDARAVNVCRLRFSALLLERRPTAIRFGGALGWDTTALAVAWDLREDVPARRTVWVPGRLRDQPATARGVAERYADAVVEMGLDLDERRAWMQRNVAMLLGTHVPDREPVKAGECWAAWDGRKAGGTFQALKYATRHDIDVVLLNGGEWP